MNHISRHIVSSWYLQISRHYHTLLQTPGFHSRLIETYIGGSPFDMRSLFLLSWMLNFLFLKTNAQDSISSAQAAATTTSYSLNPAMSSSSVASYFSSLATSAPIQPGSGPSAGDAGSSAGSSTGDSNEGAAGPDSGSITISRGGIIAIIVVVVCVVVFGGMFLCANRAAGTMANIQIVASSILWYLAKKRSWEVRKTIRRSARRVATALTPRRSTFPKDVQKVRRSSRGLTKIDEVPPTPMTRSSDIEKGNSKMSSFEMSEPPKKSKWAKKLGR